MENKIVHRLEGGEFWKSVIVVAGYEVFGTAMLVFAINATTNHPFGIALVLFEAILIGGPICGAHYNPAVTFAVFIRDYPNMKKNLGWLCLYWAAQLTGCMLGVGFTIVGLGKGWSIEEFAVLKPAAGMSNADIFFVEWLCTTLFIWIISLG